jgi:hypothetical protein
MTPRTTLAISAASSTVLVLKGRGSSIVDFEEK